MSIQVCNRGIITPQRWKTILFDQDGTLIDSLPLIRNTYRQVFTHFDLPWNDGEVMELTGKALREISEHYMQDRWPEFMELYGGLYDRDHDANTAAFAGSKEIVVALRKAGKKTGVVTGKRHHVAKKSLDYTGLWPLMDVLVGSDDVARAKPQPDSLFKAMELTASKPEECVYIGDGPYDIQAAHNAGIPCITVSWGMASREQLCKEGTDAIIDNWEDLADLFNV